MAGSRSFSPSASPVSLEVLQGRVGSCTACPELRDYCSQVARTRRRAFRDWDYWGRPVPSFGDSSARILIVGLAPAAHGANRTGRMFTGDRSGDFLYAALHRAGLANQGTSVSRDDGLQLRDVYITAALRCAPPANKPTPAQLERCLPYLRDEILAIEPRVVLCLGSIAWRAALRGLEQAGFDLPRPRPSFGHGVEAGVGGTVVMGCYHVSQQNTFTGRLTPAMLDRVLQRAMVLCSRTGGRTRGRSK
jgi:uracil-DNA glycosylase family 4